MFQSKLHNLPTVIDLTRYCKSVRSQCSSDGILVEGPSAKVAARTAFHSSNGQERILSRTLGRQWLRRSLLLQKRRRPRSHLQRAAWWGPCHQVVHLHPLHGIDNVLLLSEALRLGVAITLWGRRRPKLIIGLSGRRQILPKRKPLGCCASTTGAIIWTAHRRRRMRAFALLESWHKSVVEGARRRGRIPVADVSTGVATSNYTGGEAGCECLSRLGLRARSAVVHGELWVVMVLGLWNVWVFDSFD